MNALYQFSGVARGGFGAAGVSLSFKKVPPLGSMVHRHPVTQNCNLSSVVRISNLFFGLFLLSKSVCYYNNRMCQSLSLGSFAH